MKGIRIILNGAACVAFATTMVACSSKGSDAAAALFKGQGGGQKKVGASPTLKGDYNSACLKNPLGGWRTIELRAKGKSVAIDTKFFGDEACADGENGAPEKLKGSFQIESKKGDVLTVKFHIPIDKNVSTWRYYNIRITKGSVFLSEFTMQPEDLKGVKPSIELVKTSTDNGDGGEDKPEETPVSYDLQSGDYAPTDTSKSYCSQNVGVGRQNGVITQLMVTYLSPCSGYGSYICTDKVCVGDEYTITILSEDSYEISTGQEKIEFKRQ